MGGLNITADILKTIGDALDYKIPGLGVKVAMVMIAILVLILGIFAIKIIVALFKKVLKRGKMPELMADFLGKFVSAILNIMLLLLVLGFLGVKIDGVFIGLSAVIGLVLAFGMQDTLNNIFAGIWLATLRPINIGEVVEVNGMKGKVAGLSVLVTELVTPDNTHITIPNSQVWGSPIKNDTRMPTRRVDVDVGIAYKEDISRAVQIAMDMLKGNKMVMGDPAPDVVVTSLGDSSVNLQLRAWTRTEDYWTLRGWIAKNIKDVYGKEDINIPFPQLRVHMDV
ncbi:MAG: mechanosensitive ion channel family protein [Candidatus Thermoplasmatota archaeon]|nr:mechanosensitive ion channel family protein [Candidatus Thermoplasmatota archaeon]